MVIDRGKAIEEIIKNVFALDEKQAIHTAGVILGMKISNTIRRETRTRVKRK